MSTIHNQISTQLNQIPTNYQTRVKTFIKFWPNFQQISTKFRPNFNSKLERRSFTTRFQPNFSPISPNFNAKSKRRSFTTKFQPIHLNIWKRHSISLHSETEDPFRCFMVLKNRIKCPFISPLSSSSSSSPSSSSSSTSSLQEFRVTDGTCWTTGGAIVSVTTAGTSKHTQ